jgi:hypothetical protein
LLGLNDVVQLSSLSAASFFGGRSWRNVVLRTRGIDTLRSIVFLSVAIVIGSGNDILRSGTIDLVATDNGAFKNLLPGFAPGSAFFQASSALMALVAGIIFRKSPRLSLAVGLGAGALLLWGKEFWNLLMLLFSFALLGLEIDRRGEVTYARALGLFLYDNPGPSDHAAVAARV